MICVCSMSCFCIYVGSILKARVGRQQHKAAVLSRNGAPGSCHVSPQTACLCLQMQLIHTRDPELTMAFNMHPPESNFWLCESACSETKRSSVGRLIIYTITKDKKKVVLQKSPRPVHKSLLLAFHDLWSLIYHSPSPWCVWCLPANTR